MQSLSQWAQSPLALVGSCTILPIPSVIFETHYAEEVRVHRSKLRLYDLFRLPETFDPEQRLCEIQKVDGIERWYKREGSTDIYLKLIPCLYVTFVAHQKTYRF